MGHDELAQFLGLQHGLTHHVLRLNAAAVIGITADIRSHGGQIGQSFALLAAGDGAVRQNANVGGFADQIQLDFQMFGAVGHRLQVGHGTHGGVTAGGSGLSAGIDGFLIRKTRLTKMNVHINETWNNKTIVQFNDGKTFLRKGIGNNTTLADRNVLILEAAVRENGAAGQQQAHTGSPFTVVFNLL